MKYLLLLLRGNFLKAMNIDYQGNLIQINILINVILADLFDKNCEVSIFWDNEISRGNIPKKPLKNKTCPIG